MRGWTVFFIVALVASGLTAFALTWGVGLLVRFFGEPIAGGSGLMHDLQSWLAHAHAGLLETDAKYPFMAYGTDWLAFAHIVLGILFVGLLLDPVRNRWLATFGLICCALVIPLALICGPIRGIPWGWRMIDCSFGVFGAIPLWIVRRAIGELRIANC